MTVAPRNVATPGRIAAHTRPVAKARYASTMTGTASRYARIRRDVRLSDIPRFPSHTRDRRGTTAVANGISPVTAGHVRWGGLPSVASFVLAGRPGLGWAP